MVCALRWIQVNFLPLPISRPQTGGPINHVSGMSAALQFDTLRHREPAYRQSPPFLPPHRGLGDGFSKLPALVTGRRNAASWVRQL